MCDRRSACSEHFPKRGLAIRGFAVIAAVAGAMLLSAAPAQADWHGGGGHWRGGGGGWHGGGWRGGHWHGGGWGWGGWGWGFGTGLGLGLGLGLYDPWPGYYAPPAYAYPPVYAYPPAYAYQAVAPPVTVIQQPAAPAPAPAAAPPPQQQASYYYCQKPKGYYPYVRECSVGWQTVPVTPPAGAPPAR